MTLMNVYLHRPIRRRSGVIERTGALTNIRRMRERGREREMCGCNLIFIGIKRDFARAPGAFIRTFKRFTLREEIFSKADRNNTAQRWAMLYRQGVGGLSRESVEEYVRRARTFVESTRLSS